MQAQKEILDAAEARMIAGGPEEVRVQDLAADVGMTHSTVLHHFGSRDRIVDALLVRALGRLQDDFLALLPRGTTVQGSRAHSHDVTSEIFERASRMFRDRGYARLMAWVVLSRHDAGKFVRGTFEDFVHASHARRVQRRLEAGQTIPDLEDTLHGGAMIMVTILGDALFGVLAREAMGLPRDAKAGRRFRDWVVNLVEGYEPPPAAVRRARGKGAPSRRVRSKR